MALKGASPALDVVAIDDYILDGERFFAKELGLTPAEYEQEKKKKEKEFIAAHRHIASTTAPKGAMMKALTEGSSPTDHLLFIDDKYVNLSVENVAPEYRRQCSVLHLHATQIASGLNPHTATKLKQSPIGLAETVVRYYLGVENWFTNTTLKLVP